MKSPEVGGNDQIVVDKGDANAEELLPGWKKEVKIRKTGSKRKIDRYYTDPVTGCTFHSFKDVQRYLKTGEVGKLATRPKPNTKMDRTCLSENSSGPLSDVSFPDAIKLEGRQEKSESKEQMMVPSPVSETSRHKRPLECGSEGYKTRSKSSEMSKFESPQRASKRLAGVDAPPLSPSPEPKTRQATKLAGIKIEAFDAPSTEPKTRQATRLAGIKMEAPPPTPKTRHAMQLAGIKMEAPMPERKTRHGTQLAGVETEAPPEPKTRHATQLGGIKIDASPPSLPVPKTRQARRLAGMEIDASPPPSLPESKARLVRRLVEMETDASAPPPLPEPKTRQATRLSGTEIGTPPPELKTGQTTRLAGTEIGAPSPPQPEPKTRQATRLTETEIGAPEPKTHQATRLAGTEIGAPSRLEPKTRQATRLAGTEIDASPASLPEPKTRKATRLAGNRIGASPPPLRDPKTRQATRLAGTKTGSPPEPRTHRQDTVRRAREAETRTAVNLGTSKEIEKIAEVKKSTSGEMQVECVRKITEMSDRNASMDNNSYCKQEIPILSPPTTQESHKKIKKDEFKTTEKQEFLFSPNKDETAPAALPPVNHTAPNQQAPPPVAPPTDPGIQTDDKHHGKQESPMVKGNVNPSVSNPIPQDGNAKPESSSSMNYCLNDFWTDPCIEFAVKTLTGAIPFGDLNKADNFAATPLEVPLEELWTDPCIEFAVKTLTGAIPIGEEDYLRHQPSSSRSENRTVQSFSLAPDVGMDLCQPKHFETMHNKQQQQKQDSVGNGLLQKPGVGQGSSNVNGQCSRARFF